MGKGSISKLEIIIIINSCNSGTLRGFFYLKDMDSNLSFPTSCKEKKKKNQ